jgi:hypothetical protein
MPLLQFDLLSFFLNQPVPRYAFGSAERREATEAEAVEQASPLSMLIAIGVIPSVASR